MDATDLASVERGMCRLREAGVALDGIVLCAAPPLQPMAMHPDTAADALGHVGNAFAMAWLPLAHGLHLMTAGKGWAVVFSSAAVEDPPAQWAHYVAAKGALEGMAAAVARHERLAVLVVRPPQVWTDLTNNPGVSRTAMTAADAATTVLEWVASRPVPSGVPEILGPDGFSRPA
jgi:NAD(P)-dependent dehydrogenase (short-subunit alcohol dehydrogenase family)